MGLSYLIQLVAVSDSEGKRIVRTWNTLWVRISVRFRPSNACKPANPAVFCSPEAGKIHSSPGSDFCLAKMKMAKCLPNRIVSQSILTLAFCVYLLLVDLRGTFGQSPEPPGSAKPVAEIKLPRVELATDLGTGEPETLKLFIASATYELLRFTPGSTVGNITVLPSSDGLPRTLYDKSPKATIRF